MASQSTLVVVMQLLKIGTSFSVMCRPVVWCFGCGLGIGVGRAGVRPPHFRTGHPPPSTREPIKGKACLSFLASDQCTHTTSRWRFQTAPAWRYNERVRCEGDRPTSQASMPMLPAGVASKSGSRHPTGCVSWSLLTWGGEEEKRSGLEHQRRGEGGRAL